MADVTNNWKPKLARRAQLRWDHIEERFVLLLPEAALVLRGPAADILQLCDGTRTISVMVDELATKYTESTREQIVGDVRDFLERFQAKGLLENEP
jgi:pyrroloquinoline quinone biosynthesis protein D